MSISLDARLATLVLSRELAPRRLVAVLAVVALAAGAFARYVRDSDVLAREVLQQVDAVRTTLLALGGLLGIAVAAGAALLVIERVLGDREQGWIAIPFAAGGSRTHYLLAIVGGAALVGAAALLAAQLGWALGGAPGDASFLRRLLRTAPGSLALVASASCYGALCACLARGRGGARAIALAGIAAPAALVSGWSSIAGGAVPTAVARLVTLHLPPLTLASSAAALLRHALWIAAALVVLAALARRTVGRA